MCHPACSKLPCAFQFTSWARPLLTRNKLISGLLDLYIHFHAVIQEYDLLAIKVRDPAEFAAPFPLMLKLSREMLLEEAQSFCIVHIPSDEDGKPRKPEITMGNKYIKPTADPNQGQL